MWYFTNIFIPDIQYHGFKVAIDNVLLLWVMDFIGAKSFKIQYHKKKKVVAAKKKK